MLAAADFDFKEPPSNHKCTKHDGLPRCRTAECTCQAGHGEGPPPPEAKADCFGLWKVVAELFQAVLQPGSQHPVNCLNTSTHQHRQPGRRDCSSATRRPPAPLPASSTAAICAPQHKQVPLISVEHSEASIAVAHPPIPPHLALLKDLQHPCKDTQTLSGLGACSHR